MNVAIYKAGNTKSNLEFGKITKFENNLKEIFSYKKF